MNKHVCLYKLRCAACHSQSDLSRRGFLSLSAIAAGSVLWSASRNPALGGLAEEMVEIAPFKPCGPGASYVPTI